jgi:hypothetical protein
MPPTERHRYVRLSLLIDEGHIGTGSKKFVDLAPTLLDVAVRPGFRLNVCSSDDVSFARKKRGAALNIPPRRVGIATCR